MNNNIQVNNPSRKAALISLFILFLLEFHHLKIYPYALMNGRILTIIGYLLPILLFARKSLWKGDFMGKKLLIMYVLLAFLNIITCYIFRKQSLYVSLLSWVTLLYFLYYLTFRTWNLSIDLWEKVIIHQFLFLLFLFFLKNVFYDWDFIKLDLSDDKLDFESRVRIYSDAFLELGYLFFLNKFLVRNNPISLFFSIMAFLFIFLQGFRMMIVMGVLVSIIMILRIYSLSLRSLLISIAAFSVIVMVSLQFEIVQDKIEEIMQRNETDNFANDDYVRILDIEYTYTDFFINGYELILGAGKTFVYNLNDEKKRPHFLSQYSIDRSMLATNQHYYPVDLGFIGLSWECGILFTIVIVVLFLYLWKIKVDKQYYYISCYGLYMIFVGITNAQGYYQGNLICLAVLYVIADQASIQYKDNLNDRAKFLERNENT